jgi:hypothetical protein
MIPVQRRRRIPNDILGSGPTPPVVEGFRNVFGGADGVVIDPANSIIGGSPFDSVSISATGNAVYSDADGAILTTGGSAGQTQLNMTTTPNIAQASPAYGRHIVTLDALPATNIRIARVSAPNDAFRAVWTIDNLGRFQIRNAALAALASTVAVVTAGVPFAFSTIIDPSDAANGVIAGALYLDITSDTPTEPALSAGGQDTFSATPGIHFLRVGIGNNLANVTMRIRRIHWSATMVPTYLP